MIKQLLLVLVLALATVNAFNFNKVKMYAKCSQEMAKAITKCNGDLHYIDECLEKQMGTTLKNHCDELLKFRDGPKLSLTPCEQGIQNCFNGCYDLPLPEHDKFNACFSQCKSMRC